MHVTLGEDGSGLSNLFFVVENSAGEPLMLRLVLSLRLSEAVKEVGGLEGDILDDEWWLWWWREVKQVKRSVAVVVVVVVVRCGGCWVVSIDWFF